MYNFPLDIHGTKGKYGVPSTQAATAEVVG